MSGSTRSCATRGIDRRQFFEFLTSLSRYDLFLAIVPIAFALGLLGVPLLDLSLRQALVGAGLVGLLGIADALFLNPPIDSRRGGA